jgi:hypothetical protein
MVKCSKAQIRQLRRRKPMALDANLPAPWGRISTHGFEPTREAAMVAFARSWRRE